MKLGGRRGRSTKGQRREEFVVVMEKDLEKVKCVKCNTIIEMQHEVRRYGDEQVLRWYFRWKQGDKFLKADKTRRGSQSELAKQIGQDISRRQQLPGLKGRTKL